MQKLCKFLVLAISVNFIGLISFAQVPSNIPNPTSTDTTVESVTSSDVDLLNIFNQKTAKKYKIADIKVTGNKFFDEALLVSVSGLNVGDEIVIPGGDNFAKAIQKLWAQNYFSNVEIYITKLVGTDINIEIAVTERPRLSNFIFKGISKGQADDISPKTGLVKGRVITENMKRSAIDAINKFYFEKGYRAVNVKIDEKRDSTYQNSLALVFNVDKGIKVKINNINFLGNTVSDGKLKSQLKDTKEKSHLTLYPPNNSGGFGNPQVYTFQEYLKERGFLTFTKSKRFLDPYVRIKLFTSAKFDQKKYEDDKEKLVDYYNSLGFRDAVILKDTQFYNSQGNMNIDIKVNEGHKYYFGNISWKGNTKYSDSILTVILGIHKGDTYNLELLNKKLGKTLSADGGGDISGLYMDDGYLFFRTEPTETAVYNDTIDYEIKIIEGTQATYKNIRIAGNDKTKEYVIRRELRTLPGEKFSRTEVIRSQREIANLGYFNQETIKPDVVPNQEDGTVDITWRVEEKSSDQLELSAGFGGGIGLTGTLGVSFNNFSIKNILTKKAWDPLPTGDGQKLSVRVQSNGRAYRSYNVSFTEPWMGGKKPNSFSVSLYDTKFANAYDPVTRTYTAAKANSSYFKTTGASVGLSKRLKWPDDYFSLGYTLSFVRYTLKNYYIDQTNLPGFNNGHSNNFSLKVALQRSSIDAPIFPTSGSSLLASVQVTPPWSYIDKNLITSSNPYEWIEYHKWRFTGEWYIPLTKPTGQDRKRLVLKAAAKFGYLGRFNSQLGISPFERFQLGDAGLSNTYALLGYDIIAQRGYPVYQTSEPRYNPDQQGASEYFTMFNKYTLELRYPLSLSPSSTIYGLGFFEAANGWYNLKEYNPFKLRRSVGLGMRFFLPMFGLLGFDYGVGLDRVGTDGNFSLKSAGRFTFMLGFEPE